MLTFDKADGLAVSTLANYQVLYHTVLKTVLQNQDDAEECINSLTEKLDTLSQAQEVKFYLYRPTWLY